jgi:hypothetical protein
MNIAIKKDTKEKEKGKIETDKTATERVPARNREREKKMKPCRNCP